MRSISHRVGCAVVATLLAIGVFWGTPTAAHEDGQFGQDMGFTTCFYGNDGGFEPRIVDSVAVVGDWITLQLTWSNAEETEVDDDNDQLVDYTWDYCDAAVEDARANGLNVILKICYTPGWARCSDPDDMDTIDGPNVNGHAAPRIDCGEHWADFCRAVLRKYYLTSPGVEPVTHYEFGNEPNGEVFYRMHDYGNDLEHIGNPDEFRAPMPSPDAMPYFDYLRIAYTAMTEFVAATAPDGPPLTVIAGSLCPIQINSWQDLNGLCLKIRPDEYLRDYILKRSPDDTSGDLGGDYFDVLGYHPYGPFWNMETDIHSWNQSPLDVISPVELDGSDICTHTGISSHCSFMMTEELHEVMVNDPNCGHKEVWSTESGPPLYLDYIPDDDGQGVYEPTQSDWAEQYLFQWNKWDFTGPFLWFKVREAETDEDHFERWHVIERDFSRATPAYYALRAWGNSDRPILHVGGPQEGHLSFDTLADALAFVEQEQEYYSKWEIWIHDDLLCTEDAVLACQSDDLAITIRGVVEDPANPGHYLDANPEDLVVSGFGDVGFVGVQADLAVSNLTIEGFSDSSVLDAVVACSGVLSVDNCIIQECESEKLLVAGDDVFLENTQLLDNDDGSDSGLVMISCGSANTIKIDGCHIIENDYSAITSSQSMYLALSGCEIRGNTGAGGAAAFMVRPYSGSVLTIEDCTIVGNFNPTLVSTENADRVTIEGSEIRNNGTMNCCVLFDVQADTLQLINTQFVGNRGGMGLFEVVSSVASIEHALIARNQLGENSPRFAPIWVSGGSVTVNQCTFSNNSIFEAGPPQAITCNSVDSFHMSHTILCGGSLGNNAAIGFPGGAPADTDIRYSFSDQEDWRPAWFPTDAPFNNLIVDHEESADACRFVDPDNTENPDFRLRWDSPCMDAGDPNDPDFDLTDRDIGYMPNPEVQVVSRLPETVDGFYDVTGNCSIGASTTIVPGSVIRLRDGQDFTLFGHVEDDGKVHVGSISGPRTAIVARSSRTSQGATNFRIYVRDDVRTVFEGLLFNYPPVNQNGNSICFIPNGDVKPVTIDGRVVKFQNMVNVNDGADNPIDGTLSFEGCSGSILYLNVGQADGPGQLRLKDCSMSMNRCTFEKTMTNGLGTIPLTINGTVAGPKSWVSECTFTGVADPERNAPMCQCENTIVRFRRNTFSDCYNTAIRLYSSDVNMEDPNFAGGQLESEARNILQFVDNDNFHDPLIHIDPVGSLGMFCGRNSLVRPNASADYPIVTMDRATSSMPTASWRENFFGWACDDPIPESLLNDDQLGYIPFWAEVSESLDECLPMDAPTNPACPYAAETPYELLMHGIAAEDSGDYSNARLYYSYLLVLYPTENKYCSEGTLRLKALGLDKGYGPAKYNFVREDLFAAAAESEVVKLHLQAVHQTCCALCVEARWGDRSHAISELNQLLSTETDPYAIDYINVALLEIATYPTGGGLSGAGPEVQRERVVAHQRAVHELFNYQHGTGKASEVAAVLPMEFELSRIFPNPFNPTTTIAIQLPEEGLVQLRIFNMLGQLVAEPCNETLEAGRHSLQFNGAQFATGMYIAVVEYNGMVKRQKMLLLK